MTRRGGLLLAKRHDPEARAAKALIVAVAATVLLYVIPYGRVIGYPLLLISTIAHEMGHGVAAVLAGGTFKSFVAYSNGSGLASVSYDGRLASAFVSAGGLCGPAVAAAIAFFAARRERVARVVMIALGAFLAVSLVWVVRNVFGWLFVGALSAALLWVGIKARAATAQTVLVFLAIQLSLSVFSRGDYLFVERANTSAGNFPSDVANMATALFLPYWFWGALCGAFSVAVLAVGLGSYLKAILGPEPKGRSGR
jgi:hypothetical protein